MIPAEKLDGVLARAQALETEMNAAPAPERLVALSKEYAELEPITAAIAAYRLAQGECYDLQSLMDGADSEMAALAKAEFSAAAAAADAATKKLELLLLPKDKADDLNVIIEIRAGTGGDEAALFAGDLFRMYSRFADLCGWELELLSASDADQGGYKEIIAAVRGAGVFARLKFESGVHRVQRVPTTESSGRIHTSAATVAVLPEPEAVDIEIADKDLRIDVFRASGAGGQHVNTTDSAVRITHLPSGLVVSQQDEKSQHKNRARALQILRARLFEAERTRAEGERAAARKSQVGSGDRSERIRTYNFPQGRVSDHRINITLHKLDKILAGDGLGELVDMLVREDETRRLAAQDETA